MAKIELMKHHIADTFKYLMQTEEYAEITVQAITDAAQINRKTFYYHFPSKGDLVTYIFRSNLAAELERNIEKSRLLYDTGIEDDPFRTLPFFIKELQDGSCWPEFFLIFSDVIGRNDTYYRSLKKSPDWYYLERYMTTIYLPQIRNFIVAEYRNDGIDNPPKGDVEYLANYYTHSMFLWVLHRHATKEEHYTDTTKRHLANLFYDSITNTVRIQAERIKYGKN